MKQLCKICKKELTNRGLSNHVRAIHNLSPKQYYDSFIKKETEGVCLCGNETHFSGIISGYRTFCSCKCLANNKKIKQKIKHKREVTCLKNHGNVTYFKTRNFEIESKATRKAKYGVETYTNRKKFKKTSLKKFGVDNPLKCKKVIEKRQHTKNLILVKKYKKYIIENNLKVELKKIDNNIMELFCLTCHETFSISTQLLRLRNKNNVPICTVCNKLHSESHQEKELLDFIQEIYSDKIITNDRTILNGKEIDIFLPELNLAFEYNGLYWHSELYRDNSYHLCKTNDCEKQNIHLIHVYEDDWVYKQDIVKSRIINLLGGTKKIHGRKCVVKELDSEESSIFLNQNHLQGNVNSKIRIGLYYEKELVSLMTFGNSRFNQQECELLRFCNKLNTTVCGGANKLFNYFKKKYNHNKIISYADRSWTMNNGKSLYENLNFKLLTVTKPNYHYIKNNIRENRFRYRKGILIGDGCTSTKTEHEMMLEKGIYRIYNSGNLKYVWEPKL